MKCDPFASPLSRARDVTFHSKNALAPVSSRSGPASISRDRSLIAGGGTDAIAMSYIMLGGTRYQRMLENWLEQLRRGTLELAVLLSVAGGPRYGLEIIRHLEEFTDLVLTEGTIYPLLSRLARDGFLTSEWVAGEAPHPRKYYRLTPAGRGRLNNMCREFQVFTTKIERLMTAAGRDV
jgi:PadR family transcriptional regulator